ncbi:MAG: hypothetical protein OEY94_07850 [Alphaproteobacteria bacterium]|nr:hypothetical protein [Alphaproteobacteria bacterium]
MEKKDNNNGGKLFGIGALVGALVLFLSIFKPNEVGYGSSIGTGGKDDVFAVLPEKKPSRADENNGQSPVIKNTDKKTPNKVEVLVAQTEKPIREKIKQSLPLQHKGDLPEGNKEELERSGGETKRLASGIDADLIRKWKEKEREDAERRKDEKFMELIVASRTISTDPDTGELSPPPENDPDETALASNAEEDATDAPHPEEKEGEERISLSQKLENALNDTKLLAGLEKIEDGPAPVNGDGSICNLEGITDDTQKYVDGRYRHESSNEDGLRCVIYTLDKKGKVPSDPEDGTAAMQWFRDGKLTYEQHYKNGEFKGSEVYLSL